MTTTQKAKKESFLSKLLAPLFLITALFLTASFASDFLKLQSATPLQKFLHLWQQDIRMLEEQKKLPDSWYSIREIEVIPGTDEAKLWMEEAQTPIHLNQDGKYRLEVLILPWHEAGVYGVIVQYNMVEEKSKNMIWEFGRTFILQGDASKFEPTEEPEAPIESKAPSDKKELNQKSSDKEK